MELEYEASLEDGEISDDSDDCYKPLERPVNYSANTAEFKTVPEPEAESDELFESSSSSDSDTGKKKFKRLKLRPLKRSSEPHRKKYDIWCNRAQEDLLTETLTSCDVSNIDRSRTVETYTLTTQIPERADPKRTNNKRTFDDRNKKNLKPFKQKHEKETDNSIKGSSRLIFDLKCTKDDSCEEIAKEIANKLHEEKEDLIKKIGEVVGKDKLFELFKETKRIEEEGGMLIMNQTRRRTPGGVFIFLVKHDSDLTTKQLAEIFEDERQKHKYELKIKKRVKREKIKAKIDENRKVKTLPELLTRAELCVQKLSDRSRRKSEESVVKNPPPSPVTDILESSVDELEPINDMQSIGTESNRNITNYDEDFLDLGIESNMDLL